MNHYFKCIDVWQGVSLRPGDSSLFIKSLWGHKWPCLREHSFILGFFFVVVENL